MIVLRYLPYMLAKLKREPQRGIGPRLQLASGCFLLLVSLYSLLIAADPTAPVLYVGMAIIGFDVALGSAAELMPRGAVKLATTFRATSLALSIVGIAVVIAGFWLMGR